MCNISDMLIKSARARDVSLFLAWERGEISSYRCMLQFLKNNKRPQTDYITTYEFIRWLNSLGYRRSDNG